MSRIDDAFVRAPIGWAAMTAQTNPRLRAIAEVLGVPIEMFSEAPAPRIVHESANGDRWLLLRDAKGAPIVRHVGNAASGGHVTDATVAAFLARDPGSPQHRALSALVDAVLGSSQAAAPGERERGTTPSP